MFSLSLFRTELARHSMVLMGGTLAAQAIPLLLQPFLRRIYTAEEYGAVAIYLIAFGLLTIVFSFRYEAVIVLPKEDREAANVLSLSCLISMVSGALLTVFILLFRENLSEWIGLPEKYSAWLYLLPAACTCFALSQALNFWLTRKKAFLASSVNKVVRRAGEGAVQLVMGLYKAPGGLFTGDLAGNFLNLLVSLRQVMRNGFSFRLVSMEGMREAMKRYSDYPLFNMLPTLLSSAATLLPYLFINHFYSTASVGHLDLTRLVLSIPLIFVAMSVSQVFFRQAAEKKNRSQSILGDARGILTLLLIIVAAELLIVLPFGPWLFGFVFGDEYAVSGEYARLLVFGFALNFIGSAFSSVFIVFNRIRLNSIWQIAYFAAICGLYFLRGRSLEEFLWIYMLVEAAMHGIYCTMMFLILRDYEKKLPATP